MSARRISVWRDRGPMGGMSRGWLCRVYRHKKYPIDLRHHYNPYTSEQFKQYIVRTTGETFIDDLISAIRACDE